MANSKSTGKLALVALVLLVVGCNRAGSGTKVNPPLPGVARWKSQFRQPTSSHLRAVRAADANSVIVAGDASTILRSDDAGQNWVQLEHIPFGRGGDILSMDFFSDALECVGTDSADPTKGRYWDAINGVLDFVTPDLTATVASYKCVDVVSADTSYRLRSDRFVDMNVGGVVTTLPILPAGTWNSIDFLGVTGVGYAAGDGNLIAKFTPGAPGAWALQTTPGATAASNLKKIQFVDTLNGYACGSQQTIIFTTNGGVSWSVSNFIASDPIVLYGLHFPVDALHGWVVGTSGVIARTTTGGPLIGGTTTPWSLQAVPAEATIETLNDIWMTDNNTGYAVGTNGIVVRTTDGGATGWGRAPPLATNDYPLTNFHAVDFLDNGSIGLVVGNDGHILRTQDGGATWLKQQFSKVVSMTTIFPHLYGVSIPRSGGGQIAYACGTDGTILKTTDLTAPAPTWTDQGPGGGTIFRAILFPTGDTLGFVCGDGSGTLLRTADGGATAWAAPGTPPSPAAANWRALSADAGGANIFVAGDSGISSKAATPGTVWANLPALASASNINAFQSPLGGLTVFAGSVNEFVNTGNRTTWLTSVKPLAGTVPLGMSFTDVLTGWSVNSPAPFTGGLFYTEDGGGTWARSYVHTKNQLRGVWMSPTVAGLGYVVGDNSTILKTTTGGK